MECSISFTYQILKWNLSLWKSSKNWDQFWSYSQFPTYLFWKKKHCFVSRCVMWMQNSFFVAHLFFQGNIFMFQIDCPFVWILNLFFFLCIIIFICIFFVVYIKSIHSTEDVVVLRRQAKDKYEYSIITERNGLAKLYLWRLFVQDFLGIVLSLVWVTN